MVRLCYHIKNENKERLELLRAFATIQGEQPMICDLLNRSIEHYFISVYESYSKVAQDSDLILLTLRRMLPSTEQDETQKTDTKRFKQLAQSLICSTPSMD